MKFSEAWLREMVDPELSTDELIAQLTMAGLEVDGYEPVAASFSGVVVGEILSTSAHPDADKLVVCTVSDGESEHQIVCGAPNARSGIKVPFATVGAKLEDFKIKKAKLRGVESYGMLCSERELGLSDDHEGLMELPAEAPAGENVRDYLKLDDVVIDLDLTPNRSDCLGMTGLARETGLINQIDVNYPHIDAVPAAINDSFAVNLECDAQCPRFVGRIIRGIDTGAQSPLWLKEKLRRAGLRSIDPVVDVTNFIMLELNHPMHAYDLNKLDGEITVRLSNQGEKVDLLDGSTVELNDGTVIITDQHSIVGMGGIMGGLGSSVTADTTDLFLECAFFAPEAIAGKARSYGMNTDASHRFERGVDWRGQSQAIERATRLLLDIVGGQPGPLVDTVKEQALPDVPTVTLRRIQIKRLLGVDIPDNDIEQMLSRLEFEYASTEQGWTVSPPSHRFDIAIEADLVEEICRIYGYNTIPASLPFARLAMRANQEGKVSVEHLTERFVARGYQEAITYGFVDEHVQSTIEPNEEPVALQNPLSSEMSVMRTSLWPGLLKSLLYNLNRQQDRVRLFEVGLRFRQLPNQKNLEFQNIRQQKVLSGVVTGPRQEESWASESTPVDFFDLKGDLEFVLGACDLRRFRFSAAQHPALHPGQCAAISLNEQVVGYVGMLSPQVQNAMGLRQSVFAFEFEVDAILNRGVDQVKALSRYPEVRRDIAVVIDGDVAASEIEQAIRVKGGNSLKYVSVFDVYEGENLPEGKRSLAYALTFQHEERTLTDEEVQSVVDDVVSLLQDRWNASLR